MPLTIEDMQEAQVISREMIKDLVMYGVAYTMIYLDEKEEIHHKRVKIEELVKDLGVAETSKIIEQIKDSTCK